MKKIIVVLLLLLYVPICGRAECGPERSLDAEWDSTQMIFIGKVISLTESPIYDVYGKKLNYVSILISKIFKEYFPQIFSDTITFFQVNVESFKFRKDMEYLIFANSFNNVFYHANVCSRTCLLTDAMDMIPILEEKSKLQKRIDDDEDMIKLPKPIIRGKPY